MPLTRSRPTLRRRVAAVLTALTIGSVPVPLTATASTGDRAGHDAPRPTVVLVHGAWADSSSWDGVVRQLLRHGYPVDVFPTPLRSLSGDAASLRSYLDAIEGPVILVGHSYGGAVITDAAVGDDQVKALVYLDAFAPAEGESVLQLAGSSSALANPDPTQVFRFVPADLPPTASTDLYVLPALFGTAFANDLPPRKAAVLAVTQRPVTLGALSAPSTAAAWRTIPSWYEVGTIDRVIPAAQQRSMAARAHAHVSEVRTGHLPMVSRPAVVTRTIEAAVRATT